MKKVNIILIVLLVISLIVITLMYLNMRESSKKGLESTLQSANEVFELNKRVQELEEELQEYKSSFTAKIIHVDETEIKTLTNANKLKDKLESLEYNNEICQGIADYVLECYDGTIYYIKSECKGIQKDGKEAVLSDEEMEQIKGLILNHNINGEFAIEDESNINTTTNTTINTINSINITNTTSNNTKVTGSGNSKATSTEPYIPAGMKVADPNYKGEIKASDIEIDYDLNKVKIEVLKDTVKNTYAEILITDNNGRSWGESYRIQVTKNNKWEEVAPISDLNFIEIGYNLDENNQFKQKIKWEKLYGELEKGTYRIVKPIYNNGYIDLYSDEFEIK